MIFDIEKNIKEHESRLSKEDITMLNEEVTKLKETMNGSDAEAIKRSVDEIQRKYIKAYFFTYFIFDVIKLSHY